MSTNGAHVDFLLGGLKYNGAALDSGKVYTYKNRTRIDKETYTDYAKTTPATNPVILDSNGRAQVYADGEYTFVITDSQDVEIAVYNDLTFVNEMFVGSDEHDYATMTVGGDVTTVDANVIGTMNADGGQIGDTDLITLKYSLVEFTGWNMDTTSLQIYASRTLPIFNTCVIVRNDDRTTWRTLDGYDTTNDTILGGYDALARSDGGASASVYRKASGLLDSTDYEEGRGFYFYEYEV